LPFHSFYDLHTTTKNVLLAVEWALFPLDNHQQWVVCP